VRQPYPLLTQRLKITLDKLIAPESTQTKAGLMTSWWSQLKVRYNGRDIDFSEKLDADTEIPIDVYDSIIENLLENARSKRILQPDIAITVQLECNKQHAAIRVCDTGTAIAESITLLLFREPLSSENGFGIGLYQSYRQAETSRLKLELENNEDGRVCFLLEKMLTS